MKQTSKTKDLPFCLPCYRLRQKNREFPLGRPPKDLFAYSIHREHKLNLIIIISCSTQECDVHILGSSQRACTCVYISVINTHCNAYKICIYLPIKLLRNSRTEKYQVHSSMEYQSSILLSLMNKVKLPLNIHFWVHQEM